MENPGLSCDIGLHIKFRVTSVVRELVRYKLDLVGVQDVRWDEGGTVRKEDYIFFYGKENEKYQLGTGFFVRQIIILAVKREEFVSGMISYILLRGRCYDIIVLNAHTPTENKSDVPKDSF
jgi:hypothetical protein